MGQRGSRVQVASQRAGGFTMAVLAAAVESWMAGRDRDAFSVLRGVPEIPWEDVTAWPDADEWFPPCLMRSPYGEAWLVRFPEDLKERTALPVLSLPALREFVKAYQQTKEGRV